MEISLESNKEELIAEIYRLRKVSSDLQEKADSKYFLDIIESMPGIAYLFSVNKGGIFYSSHVEDILGYSPAELIEAPLLWHESIHPDDLPLVEKIIQKIREFKSFCIEYRIKDRKGNWHWFEDRSLEFKTQDIDFIIVGHVLDITDRKNSEILLKESQEKYQTLFATMTEGVALNEIIYDENQEMIDYRILEVNHAFYEIADFRDSQVIGNVATNLYGMSNDFIKSFWKNHKNLNKTQYAKMVSPLNKRTFLISTSPFKNNKFVTVFFDISEQERVEQKLKISEARWNFALEGSGNGVWDWNIITGEVYYSNQWKSMWGYTDSEIGNTLLEWDSRIHFEDREKFYEELENHFSKKVDFVQNEQRILCKSGEFKWVFVRGKVVEWDEFGKPLRIIGTHSDINEKKIAEDKALQILKEYHTILNNIGNGIFFVKDRKIIWANKKVEDLYGYTLSEIVGQSTAKLYTNENSYIEAGKAAYPALASGKPFLIEVLQKKKSGKEFWGSFVGQAINSENPQDGSIWIVEDISLRKKLEEDVIRHNEELEELNASKDKFFSIIAHDLKGPFSGFIALANLMKTDELSLQEMKQYSDLIHRSAENLFKLLENLLTWASIRRGGIEFSPNPFLVVDIIDEVMKVISEIASQKKIEIQLKIPDNLVVIVDYPMANAIFRNLISNAIKFTHRGGKVEICAEEKQNEILFYISDNGIGMDINTINNLFKIDQKTNRLGTEKEPSTGLGLFLCKEFVEKNKGKIWFESKENHGSTFYFTLLKGVV